MNPNSSIQSMNRGLQETGENFHKRERERQTYIVARPELVDPLGFRIFRIHVVVVVRRSIMDMTALLPPHLLLPQASDSKHKHHCLQSLSVVLAASERNHRRFQVAAAGCLAPLLLLFTNSLLSLPLLSF